MQKLTSDQIKSQLKNEKKQVSSPYKDEVDLIIDRLVDLHQQKEIDEATFKRFVSFVLVSTVNDTVSGLQSDLVKRNFLNNQKSDSNKLLLVNYSKESYA